MLTSSLTAPASHRGARANVRNDISAIEQRFSRISDQLCELWGGQEIDAYIDGLLLDDRGDRMGFPIEVLDELMFLAGIRWHLGHLCGTLIETTSAEEFNFLGNRSELCGPASSTWVLL